MYRKKSKVFIFTIKCAIAFFCWGCFIFLTKDVWDKFSDKFTNTRVRLLDTRVESKELPCFTVCPWKGFKTKGLHYETDDFLNSTLNQEEVVQTLKADAPNLFEISELKSILLGRCYTICCSKKMKKKDWTRVSLKKDSDVTGLTFWNPILKSFCILFPWKRHKKISKNLIFIKFYNWSNGKFRHPFGREFKI